MLLTAGLMLGVYTILGVIEYGWISTRTLTLAGISAVLLVAFVVRQARIDNPLMPLRLFRSREVTGSNIVMALLVVGMFGLFFLGALYLQRILGYSPLQVGLAFLPSTDRDGRDVAAVSHALRAAGDPRPEHAADRRRHAVFYRAPVDGNFVIDILPATILIGLGAGLSTPALMTLAMPACSRPTPASRPAWSTRPCRSAARSAWPSWPRWPASAPAPRRLRQALLDGYHLAFLIGAAMLGLATLVALVLLRPKRERQAKWSGEYSASVT